ncbi:aldehyde dehydrogenase family protein [Escherichia coli]|uniref:aldehyde dehydrogenase family protein n=1 Tax=Escherichia coli TaxID=562 RepID=UPI000BE3C320|nr:aldehyde dehydrogenase family protein [Escherichia coli]NJS21500.1 aldehyde dehydrogenase family protein [Escherichia coli]
MHSPFDSSTVEQQIEAIAMGREYAPRRRVTVQDLLGTPVAEMAIAPPVYIHSTISSMREAPTFSLAEIHSAMARAADSFQHDSIAGLSPDAYCQRVRRTTGLPMAVMQNALAVIAQALRDMPQIIDAGRPKGACWSRYDAQALAGCSLFSRKGDVFAVLAAGNGPGIHALWPQALALGYRVLVRPSTREPFTAQRVVCAMVKAGLAHYVALIPTDYRGADELVASADLTLAYGGQDIVDKYRFHPQVRVQGPGRAKIVVGADACLDEAAALVAKSMTDLGGAACVSASAVLVEGDTHDFGRRLRLALQQLPLETLPLVSRQSVDWLSSVLDSPIEADPTPEGYVLYPLVTEVTEPDDPRVQRELPFPCVTVAPYQAIRSAPMLSGSLVVTVFSRQPQLLEPILSDASIRNVYIGDIPTTWMAPSVPHDAYLSDFLMCNRGFRVAPSWSENKSKGEIL